MTLRLTCLRNACVALWQRTPPDLPRLGTDLGWYRRWRNAHAAARLVDEVADSIAEYPTEAAEQHAWRNTMRSRLLDFGETRLGWPPGYRRLVLADGFYDTAAAFAHLARRFEPGMSMDDLGQALRNVWVANSLQLITGRAVRLTPALFAYSMLYPATDNLLDDPQVSERAKAAFNHRLDGRLRGMPLSPATNSEAKVWALVEMVEREFPRTRHPGVWASVLAIHHAQAASLRQHHRPLTDAQLLDLTVAKGGASVLADLRLVAGDVAPADEQFAFRYGVLLQMLDDLQDVHSDLAAGHDTLFTRAATTGRLDGIAARLACFIEVVLERDAVPFSAGTVSAGTDCADVIRRNCRALIVGVVARDPRRFTRRFRRQVECDWPVSLRATRQLIRRAERRLATTRLRIQRGHGMASPIDLLLQTSGDTVHAAAGY